MNDGRRANCEMEGSDDEDILTPVTRSANFDTAVANHGTSPQGLTRTEEIGYDLVRPVPRPCQQPGEA